MNSVRLLLLAISVSMTSSQSASKNLEYPTGDPDIDAIRIEVMNTPTTRENLRERLEIFYLWTWYLQRLGVDTIGLAPIRNRGNFFGRGGSFLETSQRLPNPLDSVEMSVVAEAYAVLERLQKEAVERPLRNKIREDGISPSEEVLDEEYRFWQGGMGHLGFTGNTPPQRGELSWKAAIGYGWYSRLTVDDGAVYAVSPGSRYIMRKLDAETGETLWRTRRPVKDAERGNGGAIYWMQMAASSPLIVDGRVAVREMGSRGDAGAARDLVLINRASGEVEDLRFVGHVDFRATNPIVAAGDDFVVHGVCSHNIEDHSPQTVPFERIECTDAATGNARWNMFVGTFFAEPVCDGSEVFVCTQEGMLFCIDAVKFKPEFRTGQHRVKWSVRLDGAANSEVAVTDDLVVVGDNSGSVRGFHRDSGKAFWRLDLEEASGSAHKQFSRPKIEDGVVYVGSASGMVYAIACEDGRLLGRFDTGDWVRACPVFVDTGEVVIAMVSGEALGLVLGEDGFLKKWQRRVSEFQTLADLTSDGKRVFLSVNNHEAVALDGATGELVWKQSILPKVEDPEGREILTDRPIGGSFYYSTPIVAERKVFVGGPNRFVQCYDMVTGDLLWRYEASAQVCGAPVYENGRVFFGQEGGDENFYCVDAKTGEEIWRSDIGWVWSTAMLAKGKVLVPSVNSYLYCLDQDTGVIEWRYRTGKGAHPMPPSDGERVFFGSWDGYYYCFDIESGRLEWRFYTGNIPDSGSPVIRDGRMYITMRDRLVVLDTLNADVVKEMKMPIPYCNSTPAFSGGKMLATASGTPTYVPLGAMVHCIDLESNEIEWSYPGGGLTTVLATKDSVFFGSTADSFFNCVSKESGQNGEPELKWRYKMEDVTDESCIAIAAGRAFVLPSDGWLYCFE